MPVVLPTQSTAVAALTTSCPSVALEIAITTTASLLTVVLNDDRAGQFSKEVVCTDEQFAPERYPAGKSDRLAT